MENLKELIKKYLNYILIGFIIILIIIIGFLYSNNVTNKVKEYEEPKEEVIEEKEIKRIYVEIKGEVEHPGVYELTENERIFDVIKKAGGLTNDANTDYLNLSKKVKDEMVIIIYSKDEIKEYKKSLKEEKVKEIIKYEIIEKEIPCPNVTNEACINTKEEKTQTLDNSTKEDTTETDDNNTLINLNNASKEQLLTLTGIGESKADQIIEYRNSNKFNTIEDIKNIKGIGDSLFEKIKDSITV